MMGIWLIGGGYLEMILFLVLFLIMYNRFENI